MPNNSSEIDALLRSRPQRVVPAIFLFDESAFAKSAWESLRRACDEQLKRVVLSGAASNANQLAAQLYGSGYNQSIAPLTLMEAVPGWCVWFLSEETTQFDAFLRLLTTLDKERSGQFHHLLFLSTKQPDKAKGWVAGIAGHHCLPFLLCPHATMDRSDSDLARAAAAYAYASWKKYWEAGDANLATALTLPLDSRVLTLGMGASELDVEYHSRRCSERVLDSLRAQMLAKTQKAASPSLKGIKDFLAYLLPDWYLAAQAGGNPRSVDVRMGDESTTLHYLERKQRRLDVSFSHRRHFLEVLSRLKDKYCFLTFIALANARRFVARKALGLKAELWPPIRDYLQLPSKPDSLIHLLSERMKYCADYATAMDDTQLQGDAPPGSFQQDDKNAWARISAIPNLLGAILRLILVAIGFSGLILAPFWWGGIQHPFADALLRNVGIGSAALLVVCLVGVITHYYYSCWVADRHLDLVEKNIEVRHLREVGGLAIEAIRKEGSSLQKQMENLRERLEDLAKGIKTATIKSTRSTPAPTGSFLTDACVDVLMQPKLGELAQKGYERIVGELNNHQTDSGLVDLSPAGWQGLLTKHAASTSTEAVGLLTFDQCVAAMGPSPSQKESLIHSLVREASQPAWPAKPDADAAILCFSDPDQWHGHRGQHDTLKFYRLNLKDMLMVSVIPLREFT